ncbi:helix-turn-helix domain-containing protein [Desulfothermus sp.]
MDLKDIGLILKTEREKKGYSKEEIYKETKISIMNIEALEKGDFENLPHIVYTRAFIKSYAEFLGLDPKEFLEVFDSHYGTHSLRQKRFDSLKEVDEIKSKKWLGIFILVFVLFIVVCLIYFKKHTNIYSDKERKIQNNAVNNTHNTILENSFLEDNASSIEQTNSSQNNTNKNVDTQSNNTKSAEISMESENQTKNSTKVTNIEQNNTTETKEINKKENKEAAKNEYHTVEIRAKDKCWVKGWMDENSTKERLLSNGGMTLFKFKDKLKLKVGNAGVIDIYLDGKKVDIKGKPGQVKTLNFPFHD